MDKRRLVLLAAKKAQMTQREVRSSLEAVCKVIIEALENDENVTIQGFGSFTVKKRRAGKKALPANGKGPVKGKKRENAIFLIEKRRAVKFQVTPNFHDEYPDSGPRCVPLKNEKDRENAGEKGETCEKG